MIRGLETTTCNLCGKPIIWAETPAGAMCPMDPKVPTYALDGRNSRGQLVARATEAVISHFITCPKRDQASVKPKRKSPG